MPDYFVAAVSFGWPTDPVVANILITSQFFEIALVLVRFDHIVSGIVNANLQRLWRRIQNADVTRTRWQRYENTAATST